MSIASQTKVINIGTNFMHSEFNIVDKLRMLFNDGQRLEESPNRTSNLDKQINSSWDNNINHTRPHGLVFNIIIVRSSS